ncbi:DUF1996 domain-containing protein [Actinoplanes friuliensis]|uniref:DUF1996 domain-containing protein n=1 Tax=Actinoplanes friuliensis DSM 7358 TaxID=1246995 RepID=U5W1R7_9ACTN|nr:DUF1996 domain-containing protein [Actinoplanes friuliensis]AGZ42972.1 hypothetical protein AFR_23510 [Actinoplanes friuliensis DSM 7358]
MKVSRRPGAARMIAVAVTLAATGAATVYFVSGGGNVTASAQTSLTGYVPIASVAPNVAPPKPRRTFTVDCGTNGNGKFSPDNPVAQPGIKNGAEHVHDFVGNQAITADTSDEALAASGTTCRNGDRSSYFWPVVRIDKGVRSTGDLGATVPTISCPSVRDRLPAVPARLRAGVNRQLAVLDRSLAAANQRIAASRGRIDVRLNKAVIGSLRAQRADAIRKISGMLGRRGLVSLVDCEVSYDGMHAGHGATRSVANQTVSCPSVRDKLPAVDDRTVGRVNRELAALDKQIAKANERLVQAPSDTTVLSTLQTERAATLQRLADAITPRPAGLDALAACTKALPDPSGPRLELPGNTGAIVRPKSVLIEYRGNPAGQVTAMPRFLRALTGDAKPTSRGPANARASWTCSGVTDRLTDKYPICPAGSQVMRVHDFPGCWNGKDIDSANHRAHLAFADARDTCPAGFKAIPQLRISISYDIPRGVQEKGQYALDSFPEENHNPFSDHDDFINVNSDRQMKKITTCLNTGRQCRLSASR